MILPLLVLTTTNDLGTSEATDEMRIDRDASDARYLELLTARAQGIWGDRYRVEVSWGDRLYCSEPDFRDHWHDLVNDVFNDMEWIVNTPT